jgi:hypothetical protein
MKIDARIVLSFFFLTLLFAAAPRWGRAQKISQPYRAEIKTSTFLDNYEVVPLPDSSLVIYKYPTYDFFKAKHTFFKYDHQLKQMWETTVELDGSLDFHQMYASDGLLYVFFRDRAPLRFHILKINLGNAQYTITKYNLKDLEVDSNIQLEEFKVKGKQIFITANDHRNFLVLHLNQETNELKTLPALYDQLSALADFNLDTLANRAEFIMAESNGIKGRLQAKRFSLDGNLYTTNFIQPAFKKNFITARFSPGDSTQKLLIGAFSNRDLRYAEGLFTTPLETSESKIIYYDFLQLKHFFDFLGKRSQKRMFQRAERLKQKNKEIRLNYRIVLHDLQKHNDTLYLFAEAYTISNNQNQINRYLTRTPYPGFPGVWGNTPTQEEAEYKFSHSFVCAFDPGGKLIWDNSYVLEDAITRELTQLAQPAFARGKVILAYAFKKDIRYKIIDHDKTSDNELSEPVGGLLPDEKVTSTDHPDLRHWYGPHFITFGFQHIRQPGNPGRDVFYLNKVSFK